MIISKSALVLRGSKYVVVALLSIIGFAVIMSYPMAGSIRGLISLLKQAQVVQLQLRVSILGLAPSQFFLQFLNLEFGLQ